MNDAQDLNLDPMDPRERIEQGRLTQGPPDADGPAPDWVTPAQPKASFGTLLLFGAFALGLAAVYIMHVRSQPRAASAQEKAAEQKVENAIADLLAKDHKSVDPDALFKDTEAVVQTFYDHHASKQVPVDDVNKMPFSRRRAEKEEPAEDAAAKALAQREKERREREASAHAAFAKLKLQTVLYGETRKAVMINGQVLSLQQQIDGFAITDIQRDAVTLTRDGMTFSLRMGGE